MSPPVRIVINQRAVESVIFGDISSAVLSAQKLVKEKIYAESDLRIRAVTFGSKVHDLTIREATEFLVKESKRREAGKLGKITANERDAITKGCINDPEGLLHFRSR